MWFVLLLDLHVAVLLLVWVKQLEQLLAHVEGLVGAG